MRYYSWNHFLCFCVFFKPLEKVAALFSLLFKQRNTTEPWMQLHALWGFPCWLVGLLPPIFPGGLFLRLGYFSPCMCWSVFSCIVRKSTLRCLALSLCAALFSLVLWLRSLAMLQSPVPRSVSSSQRDLPRFCALTRNFLWAVSLNNCIPVRLILSVSHLSRTIHGLMPDVKKHFSRYFSLVS